MPDGGVAGIAEEFEIERQSATNYYSYNEIV